MRAVIRQRPRRNPPLPVRSRPGKGGPQLRGLIERYTDGKKWSAALRQGDTDGINIEEKKEDQVLTSTITAIQIVGYCNQIISGKIPRDIEYENKINEHWELSLYWKIGRDENSVFKWIEKIKAIGVKRVYLRFSRFENVYLISPDINENWGVETQLLERDPKVKWRLSVRLSNEIYQDYERQNIETLVEIAKVEFSGLSRYLKENKFPEFEQVEVGRKILFGEITKEYGFVHPSFDQNR